MAASVEAPPTKMVFVTKQSDCAQAEHPRESEQKSIAFRESLIEGDERRQSRPGESDAREQGGCNAQTVAPSERGPL